MNKHEKSSKVHADLFARSRHFTHIKNRMFGSASINIGFRAPFVFCENWIKQKVSPSAAIVDFGCGTGSFTLFHALRGFTITGFDISIESIKLAQRTSRELNIQNNINLCVGSDEAIPFADNSFDILFSSAVLSFIDLDKALSEMVRVLKPTGLALILDTMGHNPLINIKRLINLKKGSRTQWSVDHILKQSDLSRMEKYFITAEYHYFDLFVLPFAIIAAPLRKIYYLFDSILYPFVAIARITDNIIFKIPCLQKYCFKAVCIFANPIKKC